MNSFVAVHMLLALHHCGRYWIRTLLIQQNTQGIIKVPPSCSFHRQGFKN